MRFQSRLANPQTAGFHRPTRLRSSPFPSNSAAPKVASSSKTCACGYISRTRQPTIDRIVRPDLQGYRVYPRISRDETSLMLLSKLASDGHRIYYVLFRTATV